jgi:hypothetical protein
MQMPTKTYLQLPSTTNELYLMMMKMREKMMTTWVLFKILDKQPALTIETPKVCQTMTMT